MATYAEVEEAGDDLERFGKCLTTIGDHDYFQSPVLQWHARRCSAEVRRWQRFEAGEGRLHSWFLSVSALCLRT
jgi:hypothetical protein